MNLPDHGGGKHEKKVNPDKRKAAWQAYNRAATAFEDLQRMPRKTPEVKAELRRLKKQKQHLRKVAEEASESHSRRHKGQRE